MWSHTGNIILEYLQWWRFIVQGSITNWSVLWLAFSQLKQLHCLKVYEVNNSLIIFGVSFLLCPKTQKTGKSHLKDFLVEWIYMELPWWSWDESSSRRRCFCLFVGYCSNLSQCILPIHCLANLSRILFFYACITFKFHNSSSTLCFISSIGHTIRPTVSVTMSFLPAMLAGSLVTFTVRGSAFRGLRPLLMTLSLPKRLSLLPLFANPIMKFF